MNNIKNKIRKNSISLIALTLGVMSPAMLTSCGDFLDIPPQNETVLENFWNEKTDVEAVIAGCYSQLQSEAIISRMMIWGEYRSENVVYTDEDHKDANLEKVLKENLTANNGYTKWEDFYSVINKCNTILKYAPGVAEVDPSYTQTQLKADMAEVIAIRSLCYFYLIRTFRDVPYTETCYEDDSEEEGRQPMALPATDFNTVLSNLISSLEAVKDDALEGYPLTTNTYSKYFSTGRITKWAIYAMLCEMYLWQKDYDNCIKYANMIIDHKKQEVKSMKSFTQDDFANWDGYPLVGTRYRGSSTQFGQAFNLIFVEGNSIESIFELTFIKNNDNLASNVPYGNFYGGQDRKPWVNVSSYVSLDECNATYKVFDKQNKQLDMRAYEYIAWKGKEEPDHINKTTASSTNTRLIAPTANDFWNSSTWSSQYSTFGMNHDSRNKANVIYYRLSDIMLLAAEAYSQLISQDAGDVTSDADVKNLYNAFKLVNAVNKRSIGEQVLKDTLVLKNYKTKEAITNLVYEERHRELMFEGKRFYDLVRRSQRDGNTDYLASKCSNKDTNLQSIIQSKMKKMDAIYWPYNLDEIKVNPNLHQNSAFGSGESSSYENN